MNYEILKLLIFISITFVKQKKLANLVLLIVNKFVNVTQISLNNEII